MRSIVLIGLGAAWSFGLVYAWALAKAAARPVPPLTRRQGQPWRLVPSRPFDHDKDFA